MVTITKYTETNTPDNLVIVETTEDAEAFLDGLAGSYWGLPGMKARREPGQLVVEARIVGSSEWSKISTYKIETEAA